MRDMTIGDKVRTPLGDEGILVSIVGTPLYESDGDVIEICEIGTVRIDGYPIRGEEWCCDYLTKI